MSMSVILIPLSESRFESFQKDPFDAFSFVYDDATDELAAGGLQVRHGFDQLNDVLDSENKDEQADFIGGDMVGGDDPMAAIEAFEGCPPNLHSVETVKLLSQRMANIDHVEFTKRYDKKKPSENRDDLLQLFKQVKEFFKVAAENEHRVLVCMDF